MGRGGLSPSTGAAGAVVAGDYPNEINIGQEGPMRKRSDASMLVRCCRFSCGLALAVLLSCTPDAGRLLSFAAVHPIVVRDTGVEPQCDSMDRDSRNHAETLWGRLLRLYIPFHGESYVLVLRPGAEPEQVLARLEADLEAELARRGGRTIQARHLEHFHEVDYGHGRLLGQWEVHYARQPSGEVALFLFVTEYATRGSRSAGA